MKKIIPLILALLMLFAIAGCGDKPETPDNGDKPAASDSGNTDTGKKDDGKKDNKKAEYVIADQVVIDNEYCKITVKKAGKDSFWGFALTLECENKTADKTLMFATRGCVVNGYTMDPLWAQDVTAGNKSTSDLTISDSYFEDAGVAMADKMVIDFNVYDNDDYTDYVEETVTIYPTGLADADVVIPDRPTGSNELVVVDNDEYTFVIVSADPDNFWGYALNTYMENKTDKDLMFSWSGTSINGCMVDCYFGNTVPAGCRAAMDASFFDSDFEDNGITTVEKIESTLSISDADDWFADDLYEGSFTYNP